MSLTVNNSFGELSAIPNLRSSDVVLNYVSEILDKYSGNLSKVKDSEDSITRELCNFLSSDCVRFPFHFQHQPGEPDHSKKSTDFGAYIRSSDDKFIPIVLFEAKRLSRKIMVGDRLNEYVIGNYNSKGELINDSGGIERFKNGSHGKYALNLCIIGYMQSDSFSYWKKRINKVIINEIIEPHDKSLKWDFSEMVRYPINHSNVISFNSKCIRRNNTNISLTHIWVNLLIPYFKKANYNTTD